VIDAQPQSKGDTIEVERAAPRSSAAVAATKPAVATKVPWGWIAVVACTAIVCATTLGVVRAVRGAVSQASTTRTVVRSGPDVVVAIRALARMETVSFHMERVIELTDEQTHLFGLVDANDKILLVAAATITAGVDLTKLLPGDIETDWEHKRVRITLPSVELFHASLDNARTRTYRRDTDALAVRSEDLETRARQEAERAMRAAALQGGLLTRGRENAERSLRAMLGSLGFTSIELRWRDPVANERQ
jgi:hypothetical protein